MALESQVLRLGNLRVAELRSELENRGMEKRGNKSVLMKRLHDALVKEGHDPKEYQFERASDSEVGKKSEDDAKENQFEKVEAEEKVEVDPKEPEAEDVCEEPFVSSQSKEDKLEIANENVLSLTIGEDENLFPNEGEKTSDLDDGQPKEEEKPKAIDSIADTAITDGQTSDSHCSTSKMDHTGNCKRSLGRSLWIFNLLPSTRAKKLKLLLSRYGKVLGAKVLQSSLKSKNRCYGYITMDSSEAADACIKMLNKTKIYNQTVTLTRVKPEHAQTLKNFKVLESSTSKPRSKSEERPTEIRRSPRSKVMKAADSSTHKRDKSQERKPKDTKPKDKPKDAQDTKPQERKEEIKPRDRKLHYGKPNTEDLKHQLDRERQRRAMIREEENHRALMQRRRWELKKLEKEISELHKEVDSLKRQRAEAIRLDRDRQRLEREKIELQKKLMEQARLHYKETKPIRKRKSSPYSKTSPTEKKYIPERSPQPPLNRSYNVPSIIHPNPYYKPLEGAGKSEPRRRSCSTVDLDIDPRKCSTPNMPSTIAPKLFFTKRHSYMQLRERPWSDYPEAERFPVDSYCKEDNCNTAQRFRERVWVKHDLPNSYGLFSNNRDCLK